MLKLKIIIKFLIEWMHISLPAQHQNRLLKLGGANQAKFDIW